MNRPTLIPGLPRVWRTDGGLQLGSDPARSFVLRLPHPRTAAVLDLLDGSRPERLVLQHAAEKGIPSEEAQAVVDSLRAAGLAVPAASLLPHSVPAVHRLTGEAAVLALRGGTTRSPASRLRRRHAARVVISGQGRLGAPISVALAEAGVGHIHPDLPGVVHPGELAGGPLRGSDVGTPRGAAVAAALERVVADLETGAVRGANATLVVQLDSDMPVALLAGGHSLRRQPHLAVTIRDGAAVIGPLVPPTGGPCLACLDLHRKDRDAGWPGPPPRTGPEACTVATLLAATAYAVEEILAFLDGGTPETLGVSTEVTSASRLRRRTWLPHPSCDCSRPPRRRSQPPTPPPPTPPAPSARPATSAQPTPSARPAPSGPADPPGRES